MRPGKLRHFVRIQNATASQDAYGDTTDTFADVDEVYASIEPLQGAELFAAQQVDPSVSYRVRMRYTDEVTPQTRIVHGTRTLEVVSVMDREERHIELELLCKEAV